MSNSELWSLTKYSACNLPGQGQTFTLPMRRKLRLRKAKSLGQVTQPGRGEVRIQIHLTLISFFIPL